MESTQKLLIVDDHQMFIDGIKSILRKQDAFQIVAEALNGYSALEILKNQPIDIIISDISMPEMSGIELTKKVKELYPEIKILIVSMHNDPSIVSEILMAEAEGYILKNTGKKELIEALTKVANNGTFYSNDVLTVMLQIVRPEKKTLEETKQLSEREIEVLKLIVEEFSSEQIAEKLFISKRTVDTHRINILAKTNSKTLVGLIKYAVRNNLIS
ncbi:MAG: DNA-binding response regulator [Bacteroidetes bacterium HGW-Bacteroidetes-21]|jgi:DNA-binding NarL/FixJ family response regulator|nr:MAG: DNA-binding response regulator [Bacteroidetes bacterium HGW-Bacteroidetes-21]